MPDTFITLGIESSCDETSAAILENATVLSTATYSQMEHSKFGGVVPELASRAHIGKLDRLCGQVLSKADIRTGDIDLIAVTDSPGLAGALLVGVGFACGMSKGHGIPVAGVHHLEGHICAALLEHETRVSFPLLALVVSGGHTALYRVETIGHYQCLGQTVDDAAGEAFDKVGKLLGFPYPAGQSIDEESAKAMSESSVSFPIHRPDGDSFGFSFSGLKTAVKYHVESRTQQQLTAERPAICAAFQNAVVTSLVQTTLKAARWHGLNTVICSGGVAANRMLRTRLEETFGTQVLLPSACYCTDNAAMIARAGYERHVRGLDRPPCMSPSRELSAIST